MEELATGVVDLGRWPRTHVVGLSVAGCRSCLLDGGGFGLQASFAELAESGPRADDWLGLAHTCIGGWLR